MRKRRGISELQKTMQQSRKQQTTADGWVERDAGDERPPHPSSHPLEKGRILRILCLGGRQPVLPSRAYPVKKRFLLVCHTEKQMKVSNGQKGILFYLFIVFSESIAKQQMYLEVM
ncbi:hypothetical protein AVEN_4493-1 [Araneus ventricosus]|uniref:Uncharacterized protein n=1 Tax=Araneus ventricosus TaxID=182803 RepID=A0A4Y2BME1_ARAVE|nr:hypothetical protein AVEN_4493-1 [Araneus ventricosus]